jgi:hypothetical protein
MLLILVHTFTSIPISLLACRISAIILYGTYGLPQQINVITNQHKQASDSGQLLWSNSAGIRSVPGDYGNFNFIKPLF